MAHVNCAAIYGVVSMRFVGVCYAFGRAGAMLWERWSNAFGGARAMLWGCKSNALGVQEQCSENVRAML